MISIFRGRERRLGKSQNNIYVTLDVSFREHIHLFKGAAFHVFVDIALHCDEDGFAKPSYERIRRHTGYGRDTISSALKQLLSISVEGNPVLVKFRPRNEKRQFEGGNQYIVFPTPDQIAEFCTADEPELGFPNGGKIPTLDQSNVGKTQLEVEPIIQEAPEQQELQQQQRSCSKQVTCRTDSPAKPALPLPSEEDGSGLSSRSDHQPAKTTIIPLAPLDANSSKTASEHSDLDRQKPQKMQAAPWSNEDLFSLCEEMNANFDAIKEASDLWFTHTGLYAGHAECRQFILWLRRPDIDLVVFEKAFQTLANRVADKRVNSPIRYLGEFIDEVAAKVLDNRVAHDLASYERTGNAEAIPY